MKKKTIDALGNTTYVKDSDGSQVFKVGDYEYSDSYIASSYVYINRDYEFFVTNNIDANTKRTDIVSDYNFEDETGFSFKDKSAYLKQTGDINPGSYEFATNMYGYSEENVPSYQLDLYKELGLIGKTSTTTSEKEIHMELYTVDISSETIDSKSHH